MATNNILTGLLKVTLVSYTVFPKESHPIAFVHDYDAKARPKLYKLIEQGKLRILFGSTSKLGTGCNVHKRGIEFVHLIDAP